MNLRESNRRSAKVVLGVNTLLGLWLILSPFVLGPVRTAIEWNNIAVGLAVILTTLEARRFGGGFRGLEVLLGAWLFASPFVLNSAHAIFVWNNLIAAFLIIVAALAGEAVAAPSERPPMRSR